MRYLLVLAIVFCQASRLVPQAGTTVQMPPMLRARFIEDMRSKNLEDVLALYTSDASFHDPGGHDIAGREALRKLYIEVFATYDSNITMTETQHVAEGMPRNPTAIVEQGSYSETLGVRANRTSMHVCGGYVFRYVPNPQGGWLIARMEWTNEPCA
jgi:ketosteroid isomerase-like protein